MKRRLALILSAVLLIGVFVSCGSKEDTGSKAGSEAES